MLRLKNLFQFQTFCCGLQCRALLLSIRQRKWMEQNVMEQARESVKASSSRVPMGNGESRHYLSVDVAAGSDL